MKKLYNKSELLFALVFIALYVFLFSAADSLSDSVGLSKVVTVPVGLIFSAVLYVWIRKNNLITKYGLCLPEKGIVKLTDVIFIVFIISANLWNRAALNSTWCEAVLYILSMFFVGFIEEVIFRGLLFKALCKENIRTAVLVSSLTFGIGHIVNLLAGADILSTLLQICCACAIGYAFTLFFIKKGSILPCILTHSLFNSLSVFSVEADGTHEIITSLVLAVVPVLYGLYLGKKSDKILDN